MTSELELLDRATVTDAPLELSQAMRLLSGISESLSSSYARLSEHARRVENELVVTNEALAAKVAELDALRAHLEGILQALPMGVVVRDAEARIVRTNAAACATLRADARDLIGKRSHPALVGPRADGASREIFGVDGRRRIVAERSSPIADAQGRAGGSVEVLDDRTELVELDERVHKLDKLAALGSMAAGIAHEIRNPMNAMLGFAELLKRELPQHSREFRYASRISEGVCEADAIIANMLSLADPERLRRETVRADEIVAQAVEQALRPFREALEAGADAPWSITTDVPAQDFVADRVKVRQALRNLVANAIQAQPEGGSVHVALVVTDGTLAFHVTDGGPGIPPALRRRLGEPFFTTRTEGTGLGLSLVHTIADLHGGRFEVCPHPSSCPFGQGQGAHVVFKVPQHPPEKT